ncbi:MAG: (Fe-S)-binding protein [Capnocytophaga sp.]|nr:(Fe-S)-binding protein [Capnocytophaga sp.]
MLSILPNILFVLLCCIGIGFFVKNVQKLLRNIRLAQPVNTSGNQKERWKRMALLSLGQTKLTIRPIAGLLHIFVYLGFIIINIEIIEILIDGIFGTHRVFRVLGNFYNFLIGSFEILAILVILSVIIFWIRRNLIQLQRFQKKELNGKPKNDANIILYAEFIMMSLFLLMNAADFKLQTLGVHSYPIAGSFPISQYLSPILPNNIFTLIGIERISWWLHITGIFIFMNYLFYSKHLHILLAFPYTYYSNVQPKGELNNLDSVTKEVKAMLDPNNDPFAVVDNENETPTFGASDVFNLSQTQILGAYACTECGRCTDECPANLTGKLLSPRKIMMDTRDRTEEIGSNIDKNGAFIDDNKKLLDNYISREEIWACTTCNACVEACPMEINPLSIIIDLRRYLVMEESSSPASLTKMMTNIENTNSPWAYNPQERTNVFKEI